MIKFVTTDPLYYEQKLIESYETITGRTLQPADPERLLINIIAYGLTVGAINIDETGRQNLLAYASAEKLDALAEFYSIKRLPASSALTTLRFKLDAPLNFDVIIPAGTRVSPDGQIMFATTAQGIIPSGATYVDIQAAACQAGSSANGFQIGQINKLIDSLPYVTSVSNITMSLYGADEEDDERFRERIRISIERFSNAGSKMAYIYHTKSTHQDIEDVSVFSETPGEVKVVVLLKNGELPDNTMLELVREKLSDEKVRPLTDYVVVLAPSVVYYDINLTYYINKNDEAKALMIESAVNSAVNDFILWTKTKIGRDVLPEELISRLKYAGAYRVDIASPAYTKCAISEVAVARNISVFYGGIVDD